MNPRLSRLSVAFGIASLFAIAGAASAQVWTVEQLADAPVDRTGHSAVFDPIGQRMVVFGGISVHQNVPYGSSSLVYANDCWQLSLSGSPVWSALPAAGTSPSPRMDHTAVFDPVGNRMLVFGGADEAGALLDELWELSLSGTPTWTQLSPSGTPPSARSNHTAIYDPQGQRMILFGGRGTSGDFNDVWVLALTGAPAWSAMSNTGAPSVRSKHVAVYDPVGEQMLVAFGSYPDNDVFAMSLSAPTEGVWSIVVPESGYPWAGVPKPRPEAAAAFDPSGNVMAIFNGTDETWPGVPPEVDNAWKLSLAGPTPDWQSIPSVQKIAGHTAVSIPDARQIVVFGGDNTDWSLASYRRDSYPRTIRYTVTDAPASVPVEPANVSLSLDGALPNPASEGLTVGYTLRHAAPARLELWDVSGRRVLERSVDSGAGRHRVRIAAAGTIAPGVYLMTLIQGKEMRVRRTSIVR